MNFYFDAAGVLDRLDEKKGSVKGVLGTIPAPNRKRTTALVLETLKYKNALKDVLDAAGILQLEKKAFAGSRSSPRNLAFVLLHDLLFAKGGIQAGDGPLKQAILRHKTRLNAELTKLKIKRGVRSVQGLAQTADPSVANIPRYARVNTLATTVDEAIAALTARGYSLGTIPQGKTFSLDKHVNSLLCFDTKVALHTDRLYERGHLILQDKASCFPAVVLNPPADDNACVIDATAAPGNKTTLLAAIMENRGKLYAFERDKRRFKTLQTMLSRAAATNVEARNADFMSIDPTSSEFDKVTHILLDPSCSGSGIVNRLDYLLEDDTPEDESALEDRLERLSTFQRAMIAHAMRFPSARRIVYSTCSIHAAENEHVVKSILEEFSRDWELAPRAEVLPDWHRRGLQEELGDAGNADSLIRCVSGEDETNGFFVSCFIRKAAEATARGQKRKTTDDADEADTQTSKKKRKKKKKKPSSKPAS